MFGRLLTAVVVAGTVGALAGCVAGEPGRASMPRPEPPTVSGGTGAQRALLGGIVRRSGVRTIAHVRIIAARPLWRPAPRGSIGVVFSSRERSVRARWDVRLVAGAFGDLAHQRGLQPVIAYESDFGASRIGPLRRAVRPPSPRPTAAAREAIVSRLEAAAEEADAEVVELEVLAPYGLAPALTVLVGDPARFLEERYDTLGRALFGPRRRGGLDGVYLGLLDGTGELVLATYGVSRAAAGGGGWIRPDLTGCNLSFFHTADARKPPPCPIEDG
jgi:hypothetical protein